MVESPWFIILHFSTIMWNRSSWTVMNSFINKYRKLDLFTYCFITMNFKLVIMCSRVHLLMERLSSGANRSIVLNHWRKYRSYKTQVQFWMPLFTSCVTFVENKFSMGLTFLHILWAEALHSVLCTFLLLMFIDSPERKICLPLGQRTGMLTSCCRRFGFPSSGFPSYNAVQCMWNSHLLLFLLPC